MCVYVCVYVHMCITRIPVKSGKAGGGGGSFKPMSNYREKWLPTSANACKRAFFRVSKGCLLFAPARPEAARAGVHALHEAARVGSGFAGLQPTKASRWSRVLHTAVLGVRPQQKAKFFLQKAKYFFRMALENACVPPPPNGAFAPRARL